MKRTLIGLTTLTLAAGCTSAASAPRDTTPRHPTPHHRTVVIAEKDKGHVVQVHVGDTVRWVLHNTYWTFVPAGGGVLVKAGSQDSPAPPSDVRSCVPGQGCGTVEVDYRVAQTGRVVLRAHRVSCGEALRCTGDRGRFSVTIVVT